MLGELSSSDPGPYKTPVYEVGEAAAHGLEVDIT
jgi:hypothetical protein